MNDEMMPCLNPESLTTGEILSKDFDCNFGEVAAADQVVEVGLKNPLANIIEKNVFIFLFISNILMTFPPLNKGC